MHRFFFNTGANPTDDVGSQCHENKRRADNNLPTRLFDLPVTSQLTLSDGIHHHWCRVLRAKVGDTSVLFDGLGGEVIVKLETIEKKTSIVRLVSHNSIDRTPEYYSTIAIVMSRGDRLDYAIQKSTELGVTTIQLLTSQYGEVRLKSNQLDKKLNHWQQVALSASEQCGLNRPSLIMSPLSIEAWLHGKTAGVHDSVKYLQSSMFYETYFNQPILPLVLAVPNQEERPESSVNHAIVNHLSRHSSTISCNTIPQPAKPSMRNSESTASERDFECDNDDNTQFENIRSTPRFDILIGAEGGLSESEYQLARQSGYMPWQLGNRILRTETAPVVALSTLMTLSCL